MAVNEMTLDLGVGPEMEEGLEMLSKLEGITDISAMDGSLLTFTGNHVATLAGFGSIIRVEVFQCARGWYLFFVEKAGENLAAAGAELADAIMDVPEASWAPEVRMALQQAGVTGGKASSH